LTIKKGDKLIPSKGGKANIERKRKLAGLLPQHVRKIALDIIDTPRFRKQLEKEIYRDDKAIQFLAIMAKYNPASAQEGSGGGNINIQINTMVDRDTPDKEPVTINITPEEGDD
jgi:hypothetical protein